MSVDRDIEREMPLVASEMVNERPILVRTQSSCWGRRSRLAGYKGEL